jgi:hypothetical protein
MREMIRRFDEVISSKTSQNRFEQYQAYVEARY